MIFLSLKLFFLAVMLYSTTTLTRNLKAPERLGSRNFFAKKQLIKPLGGYDTASLVAFSQATIYDETRSRLGGQLIDQFTDDEKLINAYLLALRQNESAIGYTDAAHFAPSIHYFKAKELIENSQIFQMIRNMPKGAVLHGHNTAMVSSDWVLKNITYRPGLSMCTSGGVLMFTFRTINTGCTSPLVSVADERSKAEDVEAFDANLRQNFDLYTPTPEIDYPDINTVWTRFQNMFTATGDMFRLRQVFIDYHERLLYELWEDNVMYAEIRTSFGELYEVDGTTIPITQTVQILKDLVNNFKNTHPNFLGVKFIYAVNRRTTPEKLMNKINIFNSLYSQFKDIIVGFDLVGQEDLGNPLNTFYSVLNNIPADAKFFFHAGETNWYGTSTDRNVIDAVALKTHRIGHGFSIFKHPAMWKLLKDPSSGIGIEISPISNQVLGLVSDLRNHPGAFYIAENLPIVIASDDPGFWNARGLSYDMYYAYMAFSPIDGGLEIIKQLVQNSIDYSALSDSEKAVANDMLQAQWQQFYDSMLEIAD